MLWQDFKPLNQSVIFPFAHKKYHLFSVQCEVLCSGHEHQKMKLLIILGSKFLHHLKFKLTEKALVRQRGSEAGKQDEKRTKSCVGCLAAFVFAIK